MRSHVFAAFLMLAVIAPAWPVSASASPEGDDAFLGRWDITATGSKSRAAEVLLAGVEARRGSAQRALQCLAEARFSICRR